MTPTELTASVKRELRAAHAGVKFSVTRGRGTGWSWIHVSWTDGPTDAAVTAIVRPLDEQINTARRFSPEAQAWAEAQVAADPQKWEQLDDPYWCDRAPYRLLAQTALAFDR